MASSKEKIVVTYDGEIYDARAIIARLNGKDITEKFDDVGHSAEAKKILSKLKVKKLGTNVDEDENVSNNTKFITSSGLTIDSKYLAKKLFTKEDEYFVHKIFGFLALLSFLYRYFYVLPTTGNLGFSGTCFDVATLVVHFFLSFSSLIFHVVANRIIDRPLIIYEEYRLHAILFTTRCLFVGLIGMFCNDMHPITRRYVIGGTLLSIHLSVDYVTSKHGTPGVTAVRNDQKLSFKYLGLVYSFYQIVAVASHLIWCDRLGDLGFNSLIAIQSSAFLMTLKRKNIIRWYTHAFCYTFALICSYYVMWLSRGSSIFLTSAIVFFFRVKFQMNKYFLWIAYAMAIYAMIDNDLDVLHPYLSFGKYAWKELIVFASGSVVFAS